MCRRVVAVWVVLLAAGAARAQSNGADRTAAAAANPPVHVTTKDRWRFFNEETFDTMTLAAGAFNASLSQATKSDPQFGVGTGPLAERFGAAVADIASQNFLVDFAMASAFHEDTRYRRAGPSGGGIWKRAGYAISRAVVTRRDSGGETVNWANLTGTTLALGVSNLYYPPASRTPRAMEIRLGFGLAGGALVNLYPEFWPDFKGMLQRYHLFPGRW
jgi:hypothetical protein